MPLKENGSLQFSTLQSKLGSLSKDIAATTTLLQSLEPEVYFSSSTIPGAFVLGKTMQLFVQAKEVVLC